jgi:hypothetical protein
MRKKLTEAEYRKAVDAPRRRFLELSVVGSGVALRRPQASPSFWFERNELAENDGTFWRDPGMADITLMVDGTASALFYLVGNRLDSCTFAYHLTPAQLGKAVVAMKRAKLHRLIRPAAEWALKDMPNSRRPVLEKALRDVLRPGSTNAAAAARRRTKR